MYTRAMSVRKIRGPPEELYGIDVSPDLISANTDAVPDEVAGWQNRPLDICYPLVFFDAIRVKIRDEGFVRNTPIYGARHPARWNQGDSRRLDRADPGAPSSDCASTRGGIAAAGQRSASLGDEM